MTTKSPANVPSDVPPELQPYGEYDPNQSWEMATRNADQVTGHDHAKDEVLDELVGVPFLVTRITFQEGEAGKRESYVSCEAQIAPAPILEKRHIDTTKLPFDPGDLVVFNDGGTGIYRQCVAYLHMRGFIALPDPVVPEGKGPRWDDKRKEMVYVCSYDLPPSKWTECHTGEMRFNANGVGIYSVNVRLLAKRGIRISDGYENEFTKDGKTRYFG